MTANIGTIKFFDLGRNFGFITKPDGGEIYFNGRCAVPVGYIFKPGDEVSFSIGEDKMHRLYAFDVKAQCEERPTLPDRARRNAVEAAEALDPDLGKDRRRQRRREAESLFKSR
jgi:cold shock CspA family protein